MSDTEKERWELYKEFGASCPLSSRPIAYSCPLCGASMTHLVTMTGEPKPMLTVEELKGTLPLAKGGQGRSDEEVEACVQVVFWCVVGIAVILIGAVVWAIIF